MTSKAPVKPRGLWDRLIRPSATPAAEAPVSAAEANPPAREPVAAAPDTAPAQATPAPGAQSALAVSGEPAATPPRPKGWLSRLRIGLERTSTQLSDGITGLFTKRRLGQETLDELEDVLLSADLGLGTTERITKALRAGRYARGIEADDVRQVLAEEVERVLAPVARPLELDAARKPHVVLVVGVNGSGKTTTIGKLASQWKAEGKHVLIAAGDTFRAAAIDQLKIWGERTGTPVIARAVGSESASLAFDALTQARHEAADVLLIDTAGRMQNKQALMEELEKVVRVLRKIDGTAPHSVLLVLDATTGQNALAQVEVFRERVGVTGLVMTKLDGTARGGILVAIAARHALPVHAIGIGEGITDLAPFDAGDFARAIASG